MRDMLTSMPCIGRVFHVSCGSHFSCLATPSHRNMMEWSIVRRVLLGAEWRWLFPSIHRDPCGSPEIDVVGHRLADTFEDATLEAINIFCDQHPDEVARYPIGLFPTADSHDPKWTFRVLHFGHLLGDLNAQYRHQILQHHCMSQWPV
jgi:hypothetical protein